jgi:hypothetical protein
MGVPSSDVGYTSAITGRGDHEVHKGHVVAKKTSISNHGKFNLKMQADGQKPI